MNLRKRPQRRRIIPLAAVFAVAILGGLPAAEANCGDEPGDIELDQAGPVLVIGVDPGTGPINTGVAVVCINSSLGFSLNVGGGANIVDPDSSRVGFGLVPKICLTTSDGPCTPVGTHPAGAEIGNLSSPLCVGNTTVYVLVDQVDTGPQGIC